MKKYLKTGFAVLAIGAAFVSCSHDIEPLSQEEIDQIEILKINAKYEQAFIKTFGKPAANQDWGFGDNAKTRAIADYKTKGTMTASFTFPSDCDASKFNPDITNVPSYDEYCATLPNASEWWTPDEFDTGEVYIDKVQKVHIWGGNTRAKLYIKEGTYDFTNETFDLCSNADLYLLPNAKVTLGNQAASTAKFDIYIAEGAELIANGQDGFRADVDAHVYNHGTITCSKFEVNVTSFLYNVGELKCSGIVSVENSTSYIVNDGDIQSASVEVKGSGGVQNNAEWTVSGNTIVNCIGGGWVNNGHWITQNYGYTAGSENVINNCFLEVTEDFDINMSSNPTGAFKIDTGGGVLTKNFNGGKVITDPNSVSGPYKVVMGHSAVFKVTETAMLEGGNPGWGFFGPADGDYAVFQAKNVVRNEGLKNTQGAVTYSGNLYVSAETHFAQGHDGMDAEGHYFINEWNDFSVDTNIYAEGFKAGKPSVTIEETSCCPGFDGGGDDPADLRIIAEDLSAGEVGDDFDFNDVVFDVYYGNAGEAKVKILAAGGTLDLKVDGNEVHNEFSKANNNVDCAGKMINTNGTQSSDAKVRSRSLDGLTAPVITLSKEVKTPAQARDNIDIQVLKTVNGEKLWISLEAVIGKVASKVRVGTDYQWKNERQYVGDNFKDFVTGAAGYADWYKQD